MSRVQLALNVNDIDEAVSFYTKLFGTEPAKRRPGYANFAIAEPPLKLVLLENPGQGGTLNHLGVEVDGHRRRRGRAGPARRGRPGRGRRAGHHLLLRPAGQVLGQGAPGGERWEIYTVLADSATFWGQDGSQSWDAAEAALDEAPGALASEQAAQCCGGPRQADEEDSASSTVCG